MEDFTGMKILDINEEYVYTKINMSTPPSNEYIMLHFVGDISIPGYYDGLDIQGYSRNEGILLKDNYLGWSPIPKLVVYYDCYFTSDNNQTRSLMLLSSIKEVEKWIQEILESGNKGTFILFKDTYKEKKIHSTEIIKNGINKVLNE
jgi:hypothetical protein